MRRIISISISIIMVLTTCASAEVVSFPSHPVIGIAWRPDEDSEFYTNVCEAVEAAGGSYIMLPQVKSPDLDYDEEGRLTEGITEAGTLTWDAAKRVRCNTWQGSNAPEVAAMVSAVIFTGGEDVSPSLYYSAESWHGIAEELDYNAERDVSDYLLMSYCLEQDIPLMGICRGMQMLSVVSGAEVIQDIPSYFEQQGVEYHNEHRDSARGYALHEVHVMRGSLLYDIVGTETLTGCPSWHQQAIKNVENTRLAVAGYEDMDGIAIIEAVERPDKTFAIGLQFHPEAAIVKQLEGADDADENMDYDTGIQFFARLIEATSDAMDEAA